jgi:hypothetical protein
VVEATGVEGVERARAWSELPEEEILGCESPERRYAADGALERSVLVREPWTGDAEAPVALGESDEALDPVADRPGVGVQDEEPVSARDGHPRVHARSVAAVLGLDEPHRRKPLAHELGGAVRRAAVDDDHLVPTRHDDAEAAREDVARVVRDDDDRDLHARRARTSEGRTLRQSMMRPPGSEVAMVTA